MDSGRKRKRRNERPDMHVSYVMCIDGEWD